MHAYMQVPIGHDIDGRVLTSFSAQKALNDWLSKGMVETSLTLYAMWVSEEGEEERMGWKPEGERMKTKPSPLVLVDALLAH